MITDQQSKVGALQQELAGATVEIRFPAPPPPPGTAFSFLLLAYIQEQPRKSKAAPPGPEAARAGSISPVLESLEPPVMDVEEAMTQVMEEQAAMNGAAAAKTSEPQEMIVESPEEQIEEAISKIDQLEAEKMHYKYDMHSVQNSFSQ
ncbi:hypothetical protein Esti_006088 [Eimeria stiedai]